MLVLPTACVDSTEHTSAPEQKATQGTETSEDPAERLGGGSVVMMGRSVMGGWFQHWGWDWENPVQLEGYSLTYAEIDTPPGIASSACDHVRAAPEDGIVFFKFCFDDFWGEGGQEGEKQLEDMKRSVEEVAGCAADRGVVLIVGNALPKVSDYTDERLVSQHREFNAWLDEYAEASHPDILVLNMYGALSTPDGALRPEYAVGAHDSHLTAEAYEDLDPLLLDALEKASSR